MKKVLFLLCMMFGSVYAQDQTTGNLVYTTVNPAPSGTNIGSSWSGFSNVTSTGGNSTGDNGSFTGYNPSTGTFMFGYNQGTIYYNYAINQALANAGTGIQVRGYNWSWDINNLNYDDRQGSVDTLNARITTFAANNTTILQQEYWSYNTKFDWTTFSGTVNYNNPLSPAEYGNMQLMFSGRDSGFWAGYYGPMVRNISLSLNYGAAPVDPCTSDPLYSPSCPGYQQAYHDQQCSANPLYATTCPGYQQAYYTQQCSINPLYDTGCPGYQQAYFNQQCNANPLYNNQCPGYAQAYFDQQCSLDGLYDRSCPNFNQAYAKKQLQDKQKEENRQTALPSTSTSEPVVQINDDGKVSTDVPLVADPTVNQVLTKNTEPKKEQSKEEKKDSPPVSKPKANNARAAAIAAATRPDPATQTQSEKEFEQTVASQNAAVATLSLVPGFSAYTNALIPDTNALLMRRQYDKPVVDNARAMRQLNGASDRLHNEMILQQYR